MPTVLLFTTPGLTTIVATPSCCGNNSIYISTVLSPISGERVVEVFCKFPKLAPNLVQLLDSLAETNTEQARTAVSETARDAAEQQCAAAAALADQQEAAAGMEKALLRQELMQQIQDVAAAIRAEEEPQRRVQAVAALREAQVEAVYDIEDGVEADTLAGLRRGRAYYDRAEDYRRFGRIVGGPDPDDPNIQMLSEHTSDESSDEGSDGWDL
jgi:hypothetical protein